MPRPNLNDSTGTAALPNLRELHSSTEQLNQLVPERPVEAIEVFASQEGDQDWFGWGRNHTFYGPGTKVTGTSQTLQYVTCGW